MSEKPKNKFQPSLKGIKDRLPNTIVPYGTNPYTGKPFATGSIEESMSPLDLIGGIKGLVTSGKGIIDLAKAMKSNPVNIGNATFELGKHPKTIERAMKKINSGVIEIVKPNSFEEGGFVPEGMSEINIEKGELLVNPDNGKVIRSYVMQKPHNEKGKDPMVNFTIAPVGAAVIPQKWSKAYSNGDKLRRDTILRNLANKTMKENKFKTGGFVKTLGDIGMGYVNNMGSPLGIKPFEADKFYNQDIGNLSSSLGETSKQLAPMVAGMVGGPLATAGVQATQQFTSTPKYAEGTFSIPDKLDYSKPRNFRFNNQLPTMMDNFSNFNMDNTMYRSGILPNMNLNYSSSAKFPQPQGGLNMSNPAFNRGASYTNSPLSNYTTDRNSFLPPSGMGDDSASRPSNFKFDKNMAMAGAGVLGNSVGSIYDMLWTKGGKRYDRENYGSVAPNLINSSEALNQSDISYNAGKENIRRLNPNGGGLLSAYSALASKRAAARADIIQNTENQNAGIKNQFAQYNKGLEVQGMIDTSQNKARSEDIFRKGLRDTSNNALMGVKDYQTGGTNEMYLKMLSAKYGHLPAFQNFLTEANLNR